MNCVLNKLLLFDIRFRNMNEGVVVDIKHASSMKTGDVASLKRRLFLEDLSNEMVFLVNEIKFSFISSLFDSMGTEIVSTFA